MSKTKRLSFDEAFKVLQMGFQWGCEGKDILINIHENYACFVSLGNLDEINPNDLTEEMVLDAFKEEVRFIGTHINRFVPFLH